jgi:hypothetical protein
MTTRAQKIVDATMELTLRPQQGDRARVIAAAIREIVNEHQYYQFCEEEGVEDMVVDARLLYELADELEALK